MSLLLSAPLLVLRFAYDIFISTLQLLGGRLLPAPRVRDVDLTGKTAIVTGANSGIGLSLAKSLAAQNATVFLACRSIQRGEDAARQISDSSSTEKSKVHVLQLDTSDLSSVRDFAKSWKSSSTAPKQIDILVHNAGISGAPPGTEITKDGFGMIYATNFLGSFLLTSLLESSLSHDARVILTSSFGQYGGIPFRIFDNQGLLPRAEKTGDSGFYAITKSMQIVFAKLLQRRWNEQSNKSSRIAHAFTPGYTYTPIFEKMSALPPAFDPVFWFLKTATMLSTPVDVGAATGLWLCTTDDPAVRNPQDGGKYWDRCVRRLATADLLEATRSQEDFDRLWSTWCKDSGARWE
ncbi:hypothetical protein AMS68_001168 [Peltaster fructicola]|uniref:Ketoreductase (KR) domain-containing protein n=1 Tax=Peltaster fructicola TaxID=286661 RepID=A0A6H0XLY5_9PEZI|nr:hypothetical protein AMS68_001168 [Peltaster fructicola]